MSAEKNLPPLPDGVTLEDLLISLRAALETCHDTDWSLRQFKTSISHALAALAQQAPVESAGLDPLRFIRHALKLADCLPDSEIAYTLRLYLNGATPLPSGRCLTCSGHGLVGGHMPDGSGHGEPCPDCNAPQPSVPAEFDVRTILLDVVPGDGSGLEVYAKNVGDVERVLTELSESEESLRVQVDILKAAVEARGKVSKVAPVSLPEMTDEEIIEAMKSAGWPKVLVNHVAGARTFMTDLSRKSTGNDPDCNAPA